MKEGEADEELRMNLATSFDKVSRYGRDHEVAEDLLNSKNDYYERIRDLVDDPTSYVVTASQNTPGINRAVGVNRQMIEDELDDFKKSMFTDVDDGENIDATRIRDLQPGYHTVTAEVLSIDTDLPEEAPDAKGTIQDNSGAIDCISWDGPLGVEDGGALRLQDRPRGELSRRGETGSGRRWRDRDSRNSAGRRPHQLG